MKLPVHFSPFERYAVVSWHNHTDGMNVFVIFLCAIPLARINSLIVPAHFMSREETRLTTFKIVPISED